MCTNNKLFNPLSGTALDPRKHQYSLSGMMGRAWDRQGNKYKGKLDAAVKKGTVVPEGMELRAKGYGPGGV
jgi:hypothetical protein